MERTHPKACADRLPARRGRTGGVASWRGVGVWVRWAVGLAAMGLALASGPAAALEEGKPVPPFEIALGDGSRVRSGDLRGEVVVINLWATWCTFCREEMPDLETYFKRHKAEGLRVIAVSMDEAADEAKAREIMQAYGYGLGIGRLSQLKGFGRIWRLPMTFVIDRAGVLRRDGSEGEPKIDLATLERTVTPLLKAAPPRAP